MPSARKKKRAVGEKPILGISSHLNYLMRHEIIERVQRKGLSWEQAEKEVVAEFKKKYQK